MAHTLRVLILEDNPKDAELISQRLARAGLNPRARRVDKQRDFIAALNSAPDIILANYTLPQFDGLSALKLLQERNLDIPFILISDTTGEDVAAEAIKLGATDYILKGRLARLAPAVKRALKEKKLREEKDSSHPRLQTEELLASILTQSPEAIIALNEKNHIVAFNRAAEKIFGYTAEEMMGKPLDPLLPERLVKTHHHYVRNFSGSNVRALPMEMRRELSARRKDGSEFPVEIGLSKIENQGRVILIAIVVDISERKQAEQALLESEEQFRLLFEKVPVGLAVAEVGGKVLAFNDAIVKPGGYTREDIAQMNSFVDLYADPADHVRVSEIGQKQGFIFQHQVQFKRKDGSAYTALLSLTPIQIQGKSCWQVLIEDITERKKTEDALRLFRTLIDHTNDAIEVIDPETLRYLDANERACRDHGYSRDELLSKRISDVIPAVDESLSTKIREELLKSGSMTFETPFQSKDGSRKIKEITLKYVRLDRGYIVSVVRDITDRKRAEVTLKQSEARYRSLIETMNEGVIQVDNNDVIRFVNDQLCELVGYSREELIGKVANELVVQKEDQGLFKEKTKLREHQISDQYTGRLRKKTGESIWVSVSGAPIKDADGKVIGSVGICSDITERKRAEEALRLADRRYRQLFEGVSVMNVVSRNHPNGPIIIDCNELFARTLGYTRAEILGRPSSDFYTDASNAKMYEGGYQRALKGQLLTEERELLTKEGGIINVLVTAVPDTDESGQPIGTQASFVDITERKRAERDILRRTEELAALHRIGQRLNRLISPSEILEEIFLAVGQVLDNRNLFIALYDEAKQYLEFSVYSMQGERKAAGGRPFGNGLTEYVIRAGAPLFIPRGLDAALKDLGIAHIGTHAKSFMAVPMRVGEKITGVIAMQDYDRENAFSQRDLELLSTFATQAAIALENARLYAEAQHSAGEFQALYQTSQALATQTDVSALLIAIVDRAKELLHTPSGFVYLYDPTRNELELTVAQGFPVQVGMRLPIGEGMAGRVAQTLQPLMIDDYQTWEDRPPQFSDQPYRATIEVPMQVGGELIGVLGVNEFGDSDRKFTGVDADLLSLFAGQAASAVRNARLLAETKRRANEFAALYATARELTTMTELPALLQTIVERATALLSSPSGVMYLYDSEQKEMELVATKGHGAPIGTRYSTEQSTGMASYVARTRQPFIVEDYLHWENRRPENEDFDIKSALQVPMLYQGELIGLIGVAETGESTRKFTEEDAGMLSLFASLSATAVHNARLLEETRRRADEFEALFATARDLSKQNELQPLLQTITVRTMALLNSPAGGIYLYDAAHAELEVVTALGIPIKVGSLLKLGEGMAGRVALTREPLIVDDYQTWEYRSPQYDGIPFSAVVQVPMLYGGELVGVLTALETGDSRRKYTEQDVRLMTFFASHAASAVHNARLLQETTDRAQQLATLNEISRAISTHLDFQSIVEVILKQTQRVVPLDAFYVALYDADKNQMSYPVLYDSGKRYTEPPDALIKGSSLHRVVETAQPLLVNRSAEELAKMDKPINAFGDTSKKSASLIFVPLLYGPRVLGVMSVQSYSPAAYDSGHLEMLTAIGNQAAIAIENARLFEQATRRASEFEALYETTRDFATRQDVTTLLQTIVERAVALLSAPSGAMYLFDAEQGNLQIAYSKGSEVAVGTRVQLGEGMAGHVASTRQPLIVDDYRKWEGRSHKFEEVDFSSVVQVPMLYSGELIGVLSVREDSQSNRKFNEDDARLLSLLAGQAAGVVNNARLFAQAERRANEFATLYEITRDLASLSDLPTLLPTIVERATRLLTAADGFIYIYNPNRNELELTITKGIEMPRSRILKLGKGIAGRVAESRQPMIVDDYQTWEHRTPTFVAAGYRALLEVPMVFAGELIGVLGVNEVGESERRFTQDDARLLSLFAAHAASAMHNARLLAETLRRAEQLSTLNKIGTAMSAQLEVSQVLDVIYQQVQHILPLDAFYVALYDQAKNMLSYPLLYDEGKRYTEPSSTPKEGTRLIECIRTGKPLLVNLSAESHAAQPRSFMLGNESKVSKSLLYSPMRLGERVIGVMSAQSYTFDAYSEEHLDLLNGVANQAAIAIENARLFDDTQRHLQRVQALHQVDNAISGSLDLRVTFNVFLDQVIAHLGVDATDILLLNPNTQTLEFASGRGFRTPALQHTHLRLGDGLAGRAALEQQIVAITNLDQQANGLLRSPFIQSEGFTTYYGIPLIAKGRVNGVLELFDRAPIEPDREWMDFLETLAGQAAIAIDNAELYGNLQRANIDLALAYDTTLEGWSRALDLRDRETEGHTQRVTELTLRLAREVGIHEAEMVHVRRGALLHDIGKMGIPDTILFKPGDLTEDEWKIMRQHPVFAYELLSPIEFLRPALDIPYCHHEKWDGTGYPRALKGEQIPVAARLFALADVWDALRSDRPYRRAWSEEKVRELIREQSGKHFEPKVVEVFLETIK